MLFLTFVLTGFIQDGIRPIDAAKANLKSLDCKVDFTYDTFLYNTKLNKELLRIGVLDESKLLSERRVLGVWETDGKYERFACKSPENIPDAQALKSNPGPSLDVFEPFEAISDGSSVARHYTDKRKDFVKITNSVDLSIVNNCGGPFNWFGNSRFPSYLSRHKNPNPLLHIKKTGEDESIEIEQYRTDDGKSFEEDLIHYDSKSFPKFARHVSYSNSSDLALVKELYVVSTDTTHDGGVLPVVFVEAYFAIHEFHKLYPNYDHETELSETTAKNYLKRYCGSVQRRSGPIELVEDLESIAGMAGPGGQVPMQFQQGISLERAKSILGERITQPLGLPSPTDEKKNK